MVFGRPFAKQFALCYRTVVCPVLSVCPVCDADVLWPNIWIDQDVQVGLGPGHIVLDGEPPPRHQKGHSPTIFGPCLLWPNGWMDQDAIWYRGRPQSTPHCVSQGPSSSPRKGHSSPPLFSPCLLWPRSPISATGEFLFPLPLLSSAVCYTVKFLVVDFWL